MATALAVAMDAVAVSISSGMSRGGKATWRNALAMAGTFGVFQALMPALGFLGGAYFKEGIAAWDHWIAFVLLVAIGAKMIAESRGSADDDIKVRRNPFAFRALMALGLATSIDALAVGLTLSLIDMPALASIAVIGLTTFVLCVPAVRLGKKLGHAAANRAELFGGLVLVAIGVKILAEHLLRGT